MQKQSHTVVIYRYLDLIISVAILTLIDLIKNEENLKLSALPTPLINFITEQIIH